MNSMPIFILAGGFGTRLSEETELKPKPMIEIGGIPILVHIMRSYYAHGFNNFVICAGYRSFSIKEYFLNYRYQCNDLDFDSRRSGKEVCQTIHSDHGEERWRVRVIDSGTNTMTGARIARTFDKIAHEEQFDHFGLTYGDGLTDANLADELQFHLSHGKTGTVLGVKNQARYGEIEVGKGELVTGFFEKAESRQGFVSGGFFFFRREFRKYLTTDESLVLEKTPLSTLASDGQLHIYKHAGFWKCMDTLRDRIQLEDLWKSSNCPWPNSAAKKAPSLRIAA